jgi:hypothetical protein
MCHISTYKCKYRVTELANENTWKHNMDNLTLWRFHMSNQDLGFGTMSTLYQDLSNLTISTLWVNWFHVHSLFPHTRKRKMQNWYFKFKQEQNYKTPNKPTPLRKQWHRSSNAFVSSRITQTTLQLWMINQWLHHYLAYFKFIWLRMCILSSKIQ